MTQGKKTLLQGVSKEENDSAVRIMQPESIDDKSGPVLKSCFIVTTIEVLKLEAYLRLFYSHQARRKLRGV